MMGNTQVMYASDYAHWDSEFSESVNKLEHVLGHREEDLRLVLGQNAIRWFNLQPADLPAESVYFGRRKPLAVGAS